MVQWHKQVGNIAANLKVKIYFTLPEFSATEIVMCDCHLEDSDKGRYDMIPGRYLLISLGLNPKLSEHVIKADYVPLTFCLHSVVDRKSVV